MAQEPVTLLTGLIAGKVRGAILGRDDVEEVVALPDRLHSAEDEEHHDQEARQGHEKPPVEET